MEEKCEVLFNNLPLACLFLEKVGEDFLVRDVNEEYCKLVQKDKNQLLNLPVQNIFQPREVQEETIVASLKQTLITNKPVVYNYLGCNIMQAGQESFWEVTNIPIKGNDQENITYILHLLWNKTAEVLEERKRISIQKELEKQKAENEYFIFKNQDGLFSLNPEGNFLSGNVGIINLAEAPAEQLLKMSFLPFCAVQDRDKVFEHFLKALDGEEQNYIADFISCKGRKLILDVSLAPMTINGEVLGVYGVARDITDKKLLEKTINEQRDQFLKSEKKYKALVQKSSDLTAILALDGTYKFVSESSISILGISPEEFLNKNAFDFVHLEDKEAVMSCFNQIEGKKQVNIPAFRFRDFEGNWRWLETTVTNLTDDPNIQGFVTNSRDITETRQLWCETIKKNEILNEIAWEQSHIVRTPLVRLKSLFELLEVGDYRFWNREELVRLIKTSAEELDQIILETVRKTEAIEIRQPK